MGTTASKDSAVGVQSVRQARPKSLDQHRRRQACSGCAHHPVKRMGMWAVLRHTSRTVTLSKQGARIAWIGWRQDGSEGCFTGNAPHLAVQVLHWSKRWGFWSAHNLSLTGAGGFTRFHTCVKAHYCHPPWL